MARTPRHLLFKYKEVFFLGEMTASEHEYYGSLRLLKPKMAQLADQCLAVTDGTSKQYRLCKEAGSEEFIKFRLTKVEVECGLRGFVGVGEEEETGRGMAGKEVKDAKDVPFGAFGFSQKKDLSAQICIEDDEVEVKEEEMTPKMETVKPKLPIATFPPL